MARILIIGGGVAGLSAGIFAQKNGHRAIVCEKHHVAGGNLTGWQRGEYHIDNCIHWLTGTNPNSDLYKLWQQVGALDGTNVYQGDSLYTCELDGERLSLYRDIDKLEKDMLEISPKDEREIKSFINAVKSFSYFSGTGGKDCDEKASIVKKIKTFPTLYSYYNMTTGQLANRFSHPLLREFFISLLGKDFGALAFLCVASTFCSNNGGIPKGGSLLMAQRIADTFKALGGELLLGKELVRLDVNGDKVTNALFSDGTKIRADYVILTTDPAVAFEKILRIDMPDNLKKLYSNERLFRFSAVQTAFACKTTSLPFSADYIFQIPQKYRAILGSKRLVLREFSHENTFAPSDCTVIQSLTFCSEDTAKRYIDLSTKNKDEYHEKKREIANAVRSAITEKFPSLEGKIELLDVWTPASYNKFVGSQIGSFMSFAFSSKVIPSALDNRVKGINNLILASQWLQAPGGLPIALNNGKNAIVTIEKLQRKTYKLSFSRKVATHKRLRSK